MKPKERRTWGTSVCQERKLQKILVTISIKTEHLFDTFYIKQKVTVQTNKTLTIQTSTMISKMLSIMAKFRLLATG